ncbi:MAG TPA: ATP-binding protein [Acidobacteriaceae bacterium]|nr:ATP-binding protein [Acidobacteriaceae bacterium]
MLKSFQIRVAVVLLAGFTLAAAILASLNFVKEGSYSQPTDQVNWVEAPGGMLAQRVLKNGPGERAGIKAGDLLVAANNVPTPRISFLTRQWAVTGVWGRVDYRLQRSGVPIHASVYLAEADRSQDQGLRLIALVYLCIGLYVLFRRWTAPRATHFYVFCLASFVLYSFNYTGKFNTFDWTIYWGRILAGALQPALFLHLALAFPEERPGSRRNWVRSLIYLPGLALITVQVVAVLSWEATELLKTRLDQLAMGYLALYYVLAAAVFFGSYLRETNPLRRQQLKWLTRGTLLTVIPFTMLDVIPFLTGVPVPGVLAKLGGACLIFLPLTFSWAIVRYRLMDVDLIFKRGVTYTLATAALVGLYFAAVALAAEVVHTRLPSAGAWGLIAAIIITAQLFEPLKRAIQDRVDRVFDHKRYDYRQTLITFGRGLSSQTDLNRLLSSIVERLSATLMVSRVAIFFPDGRRGFKVMAAHGLPAQLVGGEGVPGLGFLNFDGPDAGSHIFLENPQNVLHLSDQERHAAASLDLNYYLPCRLQQKTIAIVGLGRTAHGDFLTSEDVELLESMASYIGIAIQNARLYASLEEKISEYERLKEFNENIVESINVGVFAVDLEERVESWNAQMEVMYAMPRQEAVGQHLHDILPANFVTEFRRLKDEPGVHNLYRFRLQTRGGENRCANVAIAPLVSRNFDVVGRIVIVDDITERMELEAQLTQADKMSSIGLLAAGVAHEVNTPLAVISSYTQMLAKQVRGDQKVAPLLDKITQQTFRASEIVNGLLNFSRTSAAEFTELDLNHVIEDTLKLLEHQFRASQVELLMSLEQNLPPILGNSGKLQQVFLNLFLNAKDAMASGGTLRVATQANGLVAVDVSDTGSGIAMEHMQRIYDPFFTTKGTVKEGQRRGTGLGLAVSYGIIQEHAGKIQVESQIGSGTTFHLEFPMARKPAHV